VIAAEAADLSAGTVDLRAQSTDPPARSRVRQATVRNCPFDALAKDYRPVVCSMNSALIDGLIAGLGIDDITTARAAAGGPLLHRAHPTD